MHHYWRLNCVIVIIILIIAWLALAQIFVAFSSKKAAFTANCNPNVILFAALWKSSSDANKNSRIITTTKSPGFHLVSDKYLKADMSNSFFIRSDSFFKLQISKRFFVSWKTSDILTRHRCPVKECRAMPLARQGEKEQSRQIRKLTLD